MKPNTSFKLFIRRAIRAAEKCSRNRLEIILYHSVSKQENSFNAAGRNIHPALFEAQMTYLQEHYQIISLEEASRRIREAKSHRKPLASVCFDDGYASSVTEAYPILQRMKIPATIFVCGSVAGNTDLLWRDKVRFIEQKRLESDFVDFIRRGKTSSCYQFESLVNMSFYQWSKSIYGINNMTIQEDLSKFFQKIGIDCAGIAAKHDLFLSPDQIHVNYDGVTFGNHSWSHPLMTLLDREAQQKEIKKNDLWLRELGIRTKMFAVPFAPFDSHTVRGCVDLSYDGLLTVSEKRNRRGQVRKGVAILNRRLAPASIGQFTTIL